jgi:hypothetical protein
MQDMNNGQPDETQIPTPPQRMMTHAMQPIMPTLDERTKPTAADVLRYLDTFAGQENDAEEVRDFVQDAARMIDEGKSLRDFGMAGYASFAEWYWEDRQPRDEGDTLAEPSFVYGDLPNVRNTRLEEASHRLVLRLRAVLDDDPLSDLFHTDEITDLSNEVEEAIELAHAAVMPVPPLLEVTGNVEEKELAARYMELKMKGVLFHAQRNAGLRERFEHMAEVLRVCSGDFRAGLHLPELHYEGRVIPYNETNDTGLRHEGSLRRFFQDVNARNVKAGWWTNIETGEPLKRSVGEMFILMVTELAEAYKAWRLSEPDDKLPQHPGVGVEMGDLLIRVADFCGGLGSGMILAGDDPANNPGDLMFQEIVEIAERYESIRKTPAAKGDPETGEFLPAMDVPMMIDDKLAFNAQRPDHKIENRLKDDGKKT